MNTLTRGHYKTRVGGEGTPFRVSVVHNERSRGLLSLPSPFTDKGGNYMNSCPACHADNRTTANYCSRCGFKLNTPSVPEKKGVLPMSDIEKYMGLLQGQNRVLSELVINLTIEIECLKELLMEQAGVSEQNYKEKRISKMLQNHSNAGPSPWKHPTFFKYLLDEMEFLRRELRLTDAEIECYQKKVEHVRQLT
jgi:hypothetical protein